MKKLLLAAVLIIALGSPGFLHAAVSDPVAYYSLSGDASDSSGNGYHGAVSGATLTADRFGSRTGAYIFNCINNHIAIPEFLSADVAAVTIAAWVKVSSLHDGAIFYKGLQGEMELRSDPAGNYHMMVKLSNGAWFSAAGGPVDTGKFQHVVGIYRRGDKIELWIDGAQAGSTGVSNLNLFGGMLASSIGAYNRTAGFFNGIIDEIAVYNRALSPAEIQALYNESGPSSVKLPRTGQTACWNAGGISVACAGTGQDGDIRAGAAWPTPRFTDNGDQTVTDRLTGLTWTKNGNVMQTRDPGFDADASANFPPSTAGDGRVTWQHALDYIRKLNQESYLGHSDWRLPNRWEMESLTHGDRIASDWLNASGFYNVPGSFNWTSTSVPSSGMNAYTVLLNSGAVAYAAKNDGSCGAVWPVRGNPAGSPGSSVVSLPKTGQTRCYNESGAVIACIDTGQDGAHQAGVAWPNPRFREKSGAVLDSLTGLVWPSSGSVMQARDPGFDTDFFAGDGKVTWQRALDYVEKLNRENYLGHNDWHLPNRGELESLVHAGQSRTDDWLNLQGFAGVQAESYWSSSTAFPSSGHAAVVDMRYGTLARVAKFDDRYVWPARKAIIGDIDGKGGVGLTDLILALKISPGIAISGVEVPVDADVDGDGRIGLAEVAYILQKMAGMR